MSNLEVTALAEWFEYRARAQGLAAEYNDLLRPSVQGMLLLDAAVAAKDLPPDDERVARLVAARRFSSIDGRVVFLGGKDVFRAKQDALTAPGATGLTVLAAVIAAALSERAPGT
jgi:hypothetical protein